MNETIILKKEKGKSFPIKITPTIRKRIYNFKLRLKEMAVYDNIGKKYEDLVYYILNDLDEYDLNLLIAYYELADCSASRLGKILNVEPSNINSRINNIQKKCRLYLT